MLKRYLGLRLIMDDERFRSHVNASEFALNLPLTEAVNVDDRTFMPSMCPQCWLDGVRPAYEARGRTSTCGLSAHVYSLCHLSVKVTAQMTTQVVPFRHGQPHRLVSWNFASLSRT